MKLLNKTSIATHSVEALGWFNAGMGGAGNGTWPAANDALFIPFSIDTPIVVKRMYSMNGNVAGNNVAFGIYTLDGARIVSIGSTAQSGTSTIQFYNITDTFLSPGSYYMAVAASGTTATFRRFNPSIILCQQMGVMKMATAFALPSTATLTTVTAAYVPSIGMELLGATLS